MATVLRLQKELAAAPDASQATGFRIRCFQSRKPVIPSDTATQHADSDDIRNWLELRSTAMAHAPQGRRWSEKDFAREFLTRPWWTPERMLFAVKMNRGQSSKTVGTVTLGGVTLGGVLRTEEASIQWLLVSPEHRREGVATALISELERRCWSLGMTRLVLETLSSWKPATAFYKALGYTLRE